jgi:hypothetical protein
VTTFTASYDITTKVITSIVVLAVFTIPMFVHVIFVVALLVLVPILGYVYSPLSYVIMDRTVVVKRLIGNAVISLEGFRSARRIDKDDTRGGIRLWGSGGLFGYYGLFMTTNLGKCTWYVTNRKNAVVIVTESKTTLFSPDDVDGFLEAVGQMAHI